MNQSGVVRIFATTQAPDYDSPWQARMPSNSTGSGIVIAPGRVLTGAHVVANSTFLQVQKVSDTNKVVAEVVAVSHDCDLALLSIADPKFMEGVTPAELGELPALQDRVSVVGYPVGGEEISVTEGVVSRIEVQRYSHSQRHLLAVTVDASINSGNSGGPVYKDGKVVGIAFQKVTSADSIGELVPPPIIRHFLAGIDANRDPRVPAIGIKTQTTENPQLRNRLGIADGEGGVLVLQTHYGGSAWDNLFAEDVILSIEGHAIASNGTVQYNERYRTRFDVLLGWKHVGDPLRLNVLRNGNRLEIELELQPPAQLVPRNQYDTTPCYFVFGGLVFQTLSRDFLATWNDWWEKAPKEFLHIYYSGVRTPEQFEVVILTQILADEINVGYETFYSEAVATVNGESIRDLADFVAKVGQATERVEIKMSSDGLIVLDADEVSKANERILSRYRITEDRSVGLD